MRKFSINKDSRHESEKVEVEADSYAFVANNEYIGFYQSSVGQTPVFTIKTAMVRTIHSSEV